jgi:hypothetical protein
LNKYYFFHSKIKIKTPSEKSEGAHEYTGIIFAFVHLLISGIKILPLNLAPGIQMLVAEAS